MSNKTRVLNKDKKVGRKKYLKGLVAGFLGAVAFLKLRDIPKVGAANEFLKLGDTAANNDADTLSTSMTSSSTDGNKGTLLITNSSTSDWTKALIGTHSASSGAHQSGVVGYCNSSGDECTGVFGYNNAISGTGRGVFGGIESSSGYGVVGYNYSAGGIGIYGYNSYPSGMGVGVKGETKSTATLAKGVYGYHNATSGTGIGVRGETASPQGYGISGFSAVGTGIRGRSNSSSRYGIHGYNATGTSIYGETDDGVGVLAETTGYGWALSVKGKSKIGGWMIPTMDNKFKLGYGKKRWKAVHAVDFLTTSLSQFKENIEPPSDINYLSTVPEPIYFNWKDGDDKQRHLGFMGDHLPDVAKEGDGGVYTSSVTAILCGAVKQLREDYGSMIQQLKEENKQLKEDYETTIRQLEKRIEQLEKNN